MPRIRKKTSRRGSTNQREKIKHKAAETRKKRKKDVKKNPQWKSKQAKDPGIPNNFPYKDQILAEVQEERRRAAEEKERRKGEKRAAKARAAGEEDSDDAGSDAGFDGVSSIKAGKQDKASTKGQAENATAEDPEDDVPVLLNRDLPTLKSVIDLADVVIQVLDAREPLRCRSLHLKKIANEKKTLFVLNKIDACPREAVSSWAATLRSQHPTILFRSASAFLPAVAEPSSKGKCKERADDAWGTDSVLAILSQWAQEKKTEEPLIVAVLGVANSGKSSFVNSLLRRAVLPTYRMSSSSQDGPTTTTSAQEVSLECAGKQVRLIDTPGLAWLAPSDQSDEQRERSRAQDILLRSRGRIERLKDPAPVVAELVSRADREDLMLFYNIPAFADGDANAFLSGVARSNGLIKKGGALDLAGASRIVLRDWSTGKFPRYTIPPSSSPSASDPIFADAYAQDENILSRLSTRKEMRKSTGVVKLKAGEPESREVALETSWAGQRDDDSNGDESDEENEADEEGEFDDVDSDDAEIDSEEDDEDEGEGSQDDEPMLPQGKRKRGTKASATPARPPKKVAFSADPKESKQSRSAAGAKGALSKSKSKSKSATDTPAKPTPTKSILKTVKQAKPAAKKTTSSAPGNKVANSSKKAATPATSTGEEAYDFGKFF